MKYESSIKSQTDVSARFAEHANLINQYIDQHDFLIPENLMNSFKHAKAEKLNTTNARNELQNSVENDVTALLKNAAAFHGFVIPETTLIRIAAATGQSISSEVRLTHVNQDIFKKQFDKWKQAGSDNPNLEHVFNMVYNAVTDLMFSAGLQKMALCVSCTGIAKLVLERKLNSQHESAQIAIVQSCPALNRYSGS